MNVKLLAVFLLTITFSSRSYSALQDYSGIYEGIDSGDTSDCNNPVNNISFDDFITIDITQSGNSFIGEITDDAGKITLSGTFIDDLGNFSGTMEDTEDGSSGVILGTFSSTQLLMGTGTTNASSDGCIDSSYGTFDKTFSGNIISDFPIPDKPVLSSGSFAEPSDSPEQAISILVNDEVQYHLLDNTGNEDWFEFYTIQGTNYTIEIPSDTTGSSINPVITLFDEQGNQLQTVDNNPTGQGEILNWTATATGLFRIRISNQTAKARNAQINALDYAYQIKVFLTDAPQQGLIKGFVLESCKKTGLAKAAVSAWAGTSLSDSTFTHKTGEFGIPLNPGSYDVISQADNYQDGSKNTNVEEVKTSQIQIDQQPITDCSQTTLTVDPIIQKQQAVSTYDDQSGLLIIKDVWAGGNAYYVELQNMGNFNFVLADAIQLPGTAHTQPADYSFGTQLLTLPTVSALGQTYKVQMKSDVNFVFTVTLVGNPD